MVARPEGEHIPPAVGGAGGRGNAEAGEVPAAVSCQSKPVILTEYAGPGQGEIQGRWHWIAHGQARGLAVRSAGTKVGNPGHKLEITQGGHQGSIEKQGREPVFRAQFRHRVTGVHAQGKKAHEAVGKTYVGLQVCGLECLSHIAAVVNGSNAGIQAQGKTGRHSEFVFDVHACPKAKIV